MKLAGQAIKGGVTLDIVETGSDQQGFYVRMSESTLNTSRIFYVHSSVSVGGKTYLLLHTQPGPDSPLIVVRLLDRNRVLTMDADRFSSLFSAFNLCLYSGAFIKGVDLEESIGDYMPPPPD